MTKEQLEMIKRMIISERTWVLVTKFDRNHDIINMVPRFRKYMPDGEIKWLGGNKAFFRLAQFHDYQYIVRHLDDGRGSEYVALLYYENGDTTKLRPILQNVV